MLQIAIDSAQIKRTYQIQQTYADQTSITYTFQHEMSQQQTRIQCMLDTAKKEYETDLMEAEKWAMSENHPDLQIMRSQYKAKWYDEHEEKQNVNKKTWPELWSLWRQQAIETWQNQQKVLDVAAHYIERKTKILNTNKSPWHKCQSKELFFQELFESGTTHIHHQDEKNTEPEDAPLKFSAEFHQLLDEANIKKYPDEKNQDAETFQQTWIQDRLQEEIKKRLLLDESLDQVTLTPYRVQPLKTGSNCSFYTCHVSIPSIEDQHDIHDISLETQVVHILPGMKHNLVDQQSSILHSFFNKQKFLCQVPLSYYPMSYQIIHPCLPMLNHWFDKYQALIQQHTTLDKMIAASPFFHVDSLAMYQMLQLQAGDHVEQNIFVPIHIWNTMKQYLEKVKEHREQEKHQLYLEYHNQVKPIITQI